SKVFVDVDLNHNGRFDEPGELGFASGKLDASGQAEVKLGTLIPGTYQVRARAVDVAGNPGPSTATPMGIGPSAPGRVALRFEPNKGQTDSQVQFLARAQDYTLFLTPNQVVLSLPAPASAFPSIQASSDTVYVPFTVNFAGAVPNPNSALGIDKLPGV